MQCSACGRESTNPNANYCDYCGTMLGTTMYREPVTEPQTVAEPKKEDRVPTWMFLGVMCLLLVPMGWIAYLVILLYWGFSANITDSKKSFARAMLIYTAVMLALVIMFAGALMGGVMNGLSGMPL